MKAPRPTEHVDVLVIGAGLSGIAAAVHIQQKLPKHRFAILEARDAVGGTWDQFRYPGVRSDSDLPTLGFSFSPWRGHQRVVAAETIRQYLAETIDQHQLGRHIRLGHKVTAIEWHSESATWLITVLRDGQASQLSANFVHAACGYYKLDEGYTPDLPGLDQFQGQVLHPQHWPTDAQLSGKTVVMIGSGATAVTLLPALVAQGAHVTQLQRSPSHVLVRGTDDHIAQLAHQWLPTPIANQLVRGKNLLLQTLFYRAAKSAPKRVDKWLRQGVAQALGASKPSLMPHFRPRHAPWDQRVCIDPDGAYFAALREGRAKVVTDQIAGIDANGVRLSSGTHLPADVLVMATGLNLLALGGMSIKVDGRGIRPQHTFSYRGVMLSGLPNFSYAFGYTSASWTLKAEQAAVFACRVMQHMARTGAKQVRPVAPAGLKPLPLMSLRANYLRRGGATFPCQGHQGPWRQPDNTLWDQLTLRWAAVDESGLRYSYHPQP